MCLALDEREYIPWSGRFTLPPWLHFLLTTMFYGAFAGMVVKNMLYCQATGHGWLWLLSAISVTLFALMPAVGAICVTCKPRTSLAMASWTCIPVLVFDAPFLVLQAVELRDAALFGEPVASVATLQMYWTISLVLAIAVVSPVAGIHVYDLYNDCANRGKTGRLLTAFRVFMLVFGFASEIFDIYSGYASYINYRGDNVHVRNTYMAFATLNYVLMGPFLTIYIWIVLGSTLVDATLNETMRSRFTSAAKSLSIALLDFVTDVPFLVIRWIDLRADPENASLVDYAYLAFNATMIVKAYFMFCRNYYLGAVKSYDQNADIAPAEPVAKQPPQDIEMNSLY